MKIRKTSSAITSASTTIAIRNSICFNPTSHDTNIGNNTVFAMQSAENDQHRHQSSVNPIPQFFEADHLRHDEYPDNHDAQYSDDR
jgi:hypothetical protein